MLHPKKIWRRLKANKKPQIFFLARGVYEAQGAIYLIFIFYNNISCCVSSWAGKNVSKRHLKKTLHLDEILHFVLNLSLYVE